MTIAAAIEAVRLWKEANEAPHAPDECAVCDEARSAFQESMQRLDDAIKASTLIEIAVKDLSEVAFD